MSGVRPSLLLALLLLPACNAELDFVRPQRFAVQGEPAAGATVVSNGPVLHITAKIASDASEFDATTVLRLLVNGVDRTAEMSIGGEFATLTLDPPPVGVPIIGSPPIPMKADCPSPGRVRFRQTSVPRLPLREMTPTRPGLNTLGSNAGMMPTKHSPGVTRPAVLGPTIRTT